MKLIFATNNKNKLNEIQNLLVNKYQIVSLKDIGFAGQIPEDHPTLEENARQKALYIYEKYKMNCFADDTGLEVEVLNDAPGVYSARYAGKEANSEKNIQKILLNMQNEKNRNARFRTIISLIEEGNETQFEGIIQGQIATDRKGKDGFGYDRIFIPQHNSLSFAEMNMQQKNEISHRGRAVRKLVEYLNSKRE